MRYLVVVDQTLGGTALDRAVHEHCVGEGAEVHVLAPSGSSAQASVEDANRRLTMELDHLRTAGIPATGAVAVAEPLVAIRDAAAVARYDGMVLATTPMSGLSKLMHMDLPHRVEREFQIPLEWIEAKTDDPSELTTTHIELPRSAMRSLRESPDY